MPQPQLFSLIDKAIFDYNLIEENDKILIGASGGKDSTALIEYFANRQRRKNVSFSFSAVHIQSEITPTLDSRIVSLFNTWNVSPSYIPIKVLSTLKEGVPMSCWWCSTRRRNELIQYALENGYTKLALGHHLDDILETLLMNMLGKGKLSTMPPRLKYKKYPLTIIRPLCYAPVEVIINHCKERGYLTTTCTCEYQENSGRKDARKRLELLTGGDRGMKMRLFNSLKNINEEYLP